ncbi:MAG: hypothetical protein KIH65_002740 [Candidatus Uhrbacteria bacterium]|nr:hypothetical protein [Candidatus Uhrbacteria bacterium]
MQRSRFIVSAIVCGAFLISVQTVHAASNVFFDTLQDELRAQSTTTSVRATSTAIAPGTSEHVATTPASRSTVQYGGYDAGRDDFTAGLAIFGGVFALIAVAIVITLAVAVHHPDPRKPS